MTDERQRSGSGTVIALIVVAVFVALPVFYVLSLGPLIWALEQSQVDETDPQAWIAVAYIYPASVLHEAGYGDWISTYVDWWA